MSHITNRNNFKIRNTKDLGKWIATAGKYSVEWMHVWKHRDGGCIVWTRFSNGDLFSDKWASFAVFEQYMKQRSRNFKGVEYQVMGGMY